MLKTLISEVWWISDNNQSNLKPKYILKIVVIFFRYKSFSVLNDKKKFFKGKLCS